LFLAAELGAAEMAEAPTNGLALIPEQAALWKESDLWLKMAALRAGIGYKDNVLLSPSAPQGSGFFLNGLDLAVNRLPLDGLEAVLVLTGDDARYWRGQVGIAGEDIVAASAQVQKFLESGWRLGMELRESYIDQIQYVILQSGPGPIEVVGNTLGPRPFVRRNLGDLWWVQLEAPLAREWYRDPLDDSWQFGPKLILTRTYGWGSTLAASAGIFYEPHNAWPALEANGTVLGKKLAFWDYRADLAWEHYWDQPKHWRLATRLGFRHLEDNGDGFYDLNTGSLSEELRFRTGDWEVTAAARAAYDDFPIQTIDLTQPGSPKLHRTVLGLRFHAERRLWKSAKVFGEYDYNEVFSDLASDQYKAQVVSGGVLWEF
jgi:hypothetical protein